MSNLLKHLVVFLALCVAGPASAQTLLGVTLGEPIPEGLPDPIGRQIQAPYAQTLWDAQDGIIMSAISDAETGVVLFIELRPAGDGTVPTPLDGLTFRETSRADLHQRFGSEGIVFANVGRTRPVGDLGVFFTSYEFDASEIVISFATVLPIAQASDDTADSALLDSIIVSNGSYLDQVWGINRGRLPGYAPIADPFADQ